MKHNFEKGYTLVEMITVIAIIVIAAGIFANFGSSQKQLSLQRDVYSFAQNIRRVQQMASSISTVNNCGQPVPKNGYGVFLETNKEQYVLYANCDCDSLTVNNRCNVVYDPPIPFESDIYKSTERVMNSPIKLSNQVKISSIIGKKGTDTYNLERVIVLYQPPDPVVQILDENGNLLDQIDVELKLQDTWTRILQINRAGLVNVKQQNP